VQKYCADDDCDSSVALPANLAGHSARVEPLDPFVLRVTRSAWIAVSRAGWAGAGNGAAV